MQIDCNYHVTAEIGSGGFGKVYQSTHAILTEGFPYIVAEYAPHGFLQNLIKEYASRPVPIDIALNVLTQIGHAISYAHQQNIIHRDLKPENILFDQAVDNFITTSLPAYTSSHSYSFTINAPGGQLTFGVCVSNTSDNSGSYTITVTQQ